MNLLTSQQLKQLDAYTIRTHKVSPWCLMERAADLLFEWVQQHLSDCNSFTILAGKGNNGGDGLALARKLIQAGKQVTVYILQVGSHSSDEYRQNESLLHAMGVQPIAVDEHNYSKVVDFDEVVIDAVFGIGFKGDLPEWLQALFDLLNLEAAFRVYVLSVDMPSGLPTDMPPTDAHAFVHPHMVLTFQCPKLPFFLPSTGKFIGKYEVLEVCGLAERGDKYADELFSEFHCVDATMIAEIRQSQHLEPRRRFSHKGTYGHALLVGGSYGKMGAVVLSGTAVLRNGAGLLTVAIPACGYTVLQTALPEAMVLTSDTDKHFSSIPIPFTPSAIGVGVGWGTQPDTAAALADLFAQYPDTPFVIDADALNLLAQQPELCQALPKGAILTPHPKELERLIGKWTDDYDKLAKAKAFADKHQVVLVLKDAYTVITDGDAYWINTTGCPALATAGSGDVLTGMLTALRTRGYDALQAAILGVYQHGQKGEEVAHRIGEEALIARDLVTF